MRLSVVSQSLSFLYQQAEPLMSKRKQKKEEAKQEDEESSSSSSAAASSSSEESEEAGNIGALKAKFESDKKERQSQRKRRDREAKKKQTAAPEKKKRAPATKKNTKGKDPKTAASLGNEEASVSATTGKKPRRQPAETSDERTDKRLKEYIYRQTKAINPDAEITEQSSAILADVLKIYIVQSAERALHLSQGTTTGRRPVISHQAAWGAARTLAPKAIAPVILFTSIGAISAAHSSQNQANEAWSAYSNLPDDALDSYLTQKMLDDMKE